MHLAHGLGAQLRIQLQTLPSPPHHDACYNALIITGALGMIR